MNWVSKRLFGSIAKPVNQPLKQRTINSSSPLLGEPKQLRQVMMAAASEKERIQAADALGRALARLLEDPQPEDSSEALVSAICHVADKALARSWLARLDGEAWLADIAVRGGLSEIRLAAAQRIQDTTLLERIVEGSRNKDKSVYRHCSELLRQRRQSSIRALRVAEVGVDLRMLLDQVPISLSRLLELEKELGSLGAGDKSPAEDEAFAVLEQARARLQAESLIQRELTSGFAAARLLNEECNGDTWPEEKQLEDWLTRLEALRQLQARLPAWLAEHAAAHELARSLSGIAARLNSFAADNELRLACERFLATHAESANEEASAAWASLTKPEHQSARLLLESRWQSFVVARSRESEPAHPASPKTTNSGAAAKLLDQLEGKLAQGSLADADTIHKELSVVLAGSPVHGAMESRLQRLNARMNELRGWARWSNAQAREQLIAKAEELLAEPIAVGDLALKIPALREEWKRIDAFGPAIKNHWERFDSVLTKAYQPVAAHRAEVAEKHAQVRVALEALCTKWEAEFAAIAWETADYPQIETRRREMLKQWHAVFKPGSRHDKGLRKRLDTLLADIDSRLAAVRAAEVERCEMIITEAQKLQELSDGGRATTRVKTLQEQWTKQRSALRLDRREEQKLWQRFRAACDAVFAKRDELRAMQTSQRKEQTQARQELLNTFAASIVGTDVKAIKYALNRFLSDMGAGENSRGGVDPLKKRANELALEAKRRIDTLLRDACRAHHNLLAMKAALAQQLEAAASTPLAQELIAAARQEWENLPKLQGKAEAILAKRFANAAGISPDKLAAGRDLRDALLLDLEMALGLPSPEAGAEKRRRRQLENLQKRFGGELQPAVDVATLVVDWYATATVPDAGLDERMAAVLSKLEDQAAAAGC